MTEFRERSEGWNGSKKLSDDKDGKRKVSLYRLELKKVVSKSVFANQHMHKTTAAAVDWRSGLLILIRKPNRVDARQRIKHE